MGLEGLWAGDLCQLDSWACELERESLQGSHPAASRAALLRRVLVAAGACASAAWRQREEGEQEAKWAPSPRREGDQAATGSCRNLIAVYEDFEDKELVFTSDSVMRVRARHVLSTRFGLWLIERGAMSWLLLGLAVLLLIFSTLDPLAELVPEDGPLRVRLPGGDTAALRVKREGAFAWLSEDLGFSIFWFLMLHYVNRDLAAKALFTFDAGMILGSFVVSEMALFYNKVYVWKPAGYYDDHWMAFDILHVLIVVVPVALAITTLDSWKVSSAARGATSWVKILLSALVTCYFVKSFYWNRVGPASIHWLDRRVCFGTICATPKKLFLQAELQKVIFLSSALIRYVLGCPFAFIRPSYKGRGVVSRAGGGEQEETQRRSSTDTHISRVPPQKPAYQPYETCSGSDGSDAESSSGSLCGSLCGTE